MCSLIQRWGEEKREDYLERTVPKLYQDVLIASLVCPYNLKKDTQKAPDTTDDTITPNVLPHPG